MAHIEKFAKFDHALSHLREYIETEENSDFRSVMLMAQSILVGGQRFYVPAARYILNESNFASMKPLMRLPYDAVALLSETYFNGDQSRTAPAISLACAPSFTGRSLEFHDEDFLLLSMVFLPEYGRWGIEPVLASCSLSATPDRIKITALPVPGIWPDPKLSSAAEMQSDLYSLTNLCVMLNLHNVTTRVMEPSARLNKKRLLHDRQPLYSYHVLVVDGECWDRPETAQSDEKGGVRSHLRRGHIRRLDETRHVWVRATYVHGSRPGFVDKDYTL